MNVNTVVPKVTWFFLLFNFLPQSDGIKQREIVEFYLQNNIDTIDSEEELVKMSKVVHSIIQRLITQERALVIVDDNEDYKERSIELHPNYYDTA